MHVGILLLIFYIIISTFITFFEEKNDKINTNSMFEDL